MSLDRSILETCRQFLLAVANAEFPESLQAKAGASDLVQETLAGAHRNWDQFRGRTLADLRAWLRSILLNELAMFRRHYTTVEARDATREVPLTAATTGLTAETPPLAPLIRAEQNRALTDAVRKLPDEYRWALVLRVEHGLSFAAIGEKLGRTEDAARKLYSRTIDQLRGRLVDAHE